MISGLALVLFGAACGKAVESPGDDRAVAGGGAGAAVTAGAAGAASDSAAAANGGGGANMAGATDLLAPLDTDDATIDNSTGQGLLELTMSIGYARGVALCTCLSGPPSAGDLDGCARAESTLQGLFEPALQRCVVEQSRAIPGFDERVRCRARDLRAEGRGYRQCPEGADGGTHNLSGIVLPPCEENEAADRMLAGYTCSEAILCTDGTLHVTGRCDQHRDCPDGSDERGCGDFSCGDKLIYRLQACDPTLCSFAFDPPLCAADDASQFLCGDGSRVFVGVLCDKVEDCADGRDEQYCFY